MSSSAAVEFYVSRTHRFREATQVLHRAAIRAWGNLLWAWPRDGRRDYTAQGLDMHEHAQFEDGSVSVEAGIMDMLARMQTGRVG